MGPEGGLPWVEGLHVPHFLGDEGYMCFFLAENATRCENTVFLSIPAHFPKVTRADLDLILKLPGVGA